MHEELEVSVAEARAGWSELVAKVVYQGARVTLIKHGRKVAMIVPFPVRSRKPRRSEKRSSKAR